MINKTESLLEQLESYIAVDADTMDHEFIRTLPIQCHDMTSNQKFVHEALVDPRNKDIVESTVKEMKGQPWEEVYAVCIAKFAANVLPLISGRVLAQTSPTHAHDEEYVYENARHYAKAFNAQGITNDRFVVKIAVTSAGVRAAKRLAAEGISTLGTTLFSVHQALAAHQAGMVAVSMYFNDPAAHTDASIWPDVAEPLSQHPMAARHIQIRLAFNRIAKATGKKVPEMKTASVVSAREVLTLVDMGADHTTLGKPMLEDLMSYSNLPAHQKGYWKKTIKDQGQDPNVIWEKWAPLSPNQERMVELAATGPFSKFTMEDGKVIDESIDFLAPGVVDKLNEQDEVSRLRIAEGLKRFGLMEAESKKVIEGLQEQFA